MLDFCLITPDQALGILVSLPGSKRCRLLVYAGQSLIHLLHVCGVEYAGR